jgi:hypothetical protein
MLARKHRAQYGNSGGGFNNPTAAAASSKRAILNRTSCPVVFKQQPNTTSSNYLREKKAELMKCNDIINPGKTATGKDPENKNGKTNNLCETTQNMSTKTQGEYIRENTYCPLDASQQKPFVVNHNC